MGAPSQIWRARMIHLLIQRPAKRHAALDRRQRVGVVAQVPIEEAPNVFNRGAAPVPMSERTAHGYGQRQHNARNSIRTVAVSKRPRPRSRSLPIKRTRCQYRHHLRAAASIIASTASFTASSSIGSMSASSCAIASRTASVPPVGVAPRRGGLTPIACRSNATVETCSVTHPE